MRKNTIFKMTFSGMMFALILLFQLAEHIMPFGDFGFVNFNITLPFIIITSYIAGLPFAFFQLALRFVFGPLLKGSYDPLTIIGHISLLTYGIIALLIWHFINKASFAKERQLAWKWWLGLSFLASVILSAFFAFVNAIIFVPWYFASTDLNWHIPQSLFKAYNTYGFLNQFYFFIPNYWGGMMSVYFVFNIINFALNLFILWPLLKVGHGISLKMG